MKILIVDTYYPAFTKAFYESHPENLNLPYRTQREALFQASFGNSDFYSRNLSALGHEVEVVVANCWPLQLAWASEHGLKLGYQRWLVGKAREMMVLEEQVRRFQPEIIYVQNLIYFDADFLRHIGSFARSIVGQNACPLNWTYDLTCYDLIVTSFPHYLDKFSSSGVDSAYLPLGFDPVVLERLPADPARFETVFVGGLTAHHDRGNRLLEGVASHVPLDIWGYGVEDLPKNSPLLDRYRGEAWGLDMYRILASAKISLNRHIDVAESFANNMRLYEATGVGSCVLTDWKVNLDQFFEPDREVVTYRSAEECVEKALYLLNNEAARQAIATAGQRRTVAEHTYGRRMEELSEILDARLYRTNGPKSGIQHRADKWKKPRPDLKSTVRHLLRESPAGPAARWLYRRLRKMYMTLRRF